jgi:hypothetical protein
MCLTPRVSKESQKLAIFDGGSITSNSLPRGGSFTINNLPKFLASSPFAAV